MRRTRNEISAHWTCIMCSDKDECTKRSSQVVPGVGQVVMNGMIDWSQNALDSNRKTYNIT